MRSYGPADVLRWVSRQVREELGKSWADGDGQSALLAGPRYVVRPFGAITAQTPHQFAGPSQFAREVMGVIVDLLKQPTLGTDANLEDWASIFEPAYSIQQRLENSENFALRDGDRTDTTQQYGGIQVVQVLSKTPQERSFPTETPGSELHVFGIRLALQVQFTRWEDAR